MLTVQDIEAWRARQGLSVKDLAGKLRVNYQHLAGVLRGVRPLTEKLSALVEMEMQREAEGLKVAILPQYEPLLRAWAATANISVDALVHELLAEALRAKLRPRDGEDEGTWLDAADEPRKP